MITVEKPPKYSSCISCGTKESLHEYLFSIRDDGIKQCVTICNDCISTMYKKSKETKMTDSCCKGAEQPKSEDVAQNGCKSLNGYVIPKDLLGLWEATICEIRGEIKSWDLKGPHVSNYAEGLCDKLEYSMCALAGGPYALRYNIE